MSESATHKRLVNNLHQWIIQTYHNEDIYIWVDSSQDIQSTRPITIEKFVPDVYAFFFSKPIRIIGEAKTPRDLMTKRSEQQIVAFLRYCSINPMFIFVLAVPWDHEKYAKNMITYLKRDFDALNAKTIVLERLEN
jgi:hypothetical protein